MKSRRALIAAMLLSFTFLFAVACNPLRTFSTQQFLKTTDTSVVEISNPPMKFGCSYDWAGWWPWAVAQEQHIFEENGANVELQWFDNYYEALDALAQGVLDANCQVFNDTVESVNHAVNGEVVVLITDNSDGNDKIIATDSIETISDLVGNQVGVEQGKLTDFLLTLVLENSGLSRDAIDVRYLNTATSAIAFVAGALDAVVAWQPDWLTALRRPRSHELLSSGDLPGAIPQVVAVSQRAIKEQEHQVQAIVNTWFKTLEFIHDQPEVSKEIMLRRSTLSEADYQLFMNGVCLFSIEENITAFSSGQTLEHLPFTAQKVSDFLIGTGNISQSPNLTQLLNDSFVKQYETEVH
ncbi:MAG: aliphatic sulfonate ABC transporter substrate-binding protein [Elainellaceae cyanobacterium]